MPRSEERRVREGSENVKRVYNILETILDMILQMTIKVDNMGPFSQFYELFRTVLGSADSFEGIFGNLENSCIWSFLAVL